MPTLLYRDFTLVKGRTFDSWRRVGSAMQAIKVYEMRRVDELIFLDISATLQSREPDFALIDDLADECFMPFTVGGGIRNVGQVRRMLLAGADKISINTASIENPALISEIASQFGSQCCVVSIDYRRNLDGRHEVYTHSGNTPAELNPVDHAKRCEDLGAGEILLTSIEHDGNMTGYDIETLREVTEAVRIPVIASGGCGNYADMDAALSQGGASAVAAASIFHFTEMTPLEAKLYLKEQGHSIRL
jgi:imidazole glycerol-phosphate synthase subunit HisF